VLQEKECLLACIEETPLHLPQLAAAGDSAAGLRLDSPIYLKLSSSWDDFSTLRMARVRSPETRAKSPAIASVDEPAGNVIRYPGPGVTPTGARMMDAAPRMNCRAISLMETRLPSIKDLCQDPAVQFSKVATK